jgi:sugar/nucleoside kinase (ribokinase family)
MSETERHPLQPLQLHEAVKQNIQPLSSAIQSIPEEAEAVVAGYVCLHLFPAIPEQAKPFAPGQFIEVGGMDMTAAGAVPFTGLALHKLGVTTRLMGKVGNDLFGQALLHRLEEQAHDVTSNMIIAPEDSSSYAIILRSAKGEQTTFYASGCNDTFNADDIYYTLLEKAGLFHFGYPPLMARMYQEQGSELVELFRRAKERGVTTSLDLSLPDVTNIEHRADWQAILSETLPYVDVFLPSIDELLQILRRPLFEKLSSRSGNTPLVDLVAPEVISELGQALIDMGAKIVGIKVGHRGLYLRTPSIEKLEHFGRFQPSKVSMWANRELWAPCFATQVVDTVGSGDATVAGFLFGLIRGMSPTATLSAACAVGACSVEDVGALAGIQSWPTILERIAAGWSRLMPAAKPRSVLDLAHSAWRWHEAQEIWVGPRDQNYKPLL